MWTAREFSVAEAAAISGLPRAHLDLIVHRAKACEVLFSEKRKHRRWFSPRDIAVLRIAHELERGGRSWLDALGIAFDHLEHPPRPDALLSLTPTPVRASGGPKVLTGGHANLHIDQAALLIPIGRIVAEIVERCASIKEAA